MKANCGDNNPFLRFAIAAAVAATFAVVLDMHDVLAVDFRSESGIESAFARYGVTGKGVTIAILDRGIQWNNQDFIKADGKTRIKAILDMTGQSWCDSSNVPPTEFSEAQINEALSNNSMLWTHDAVGHGTATAGIAAGNGRAFADGKYRGAAPEADLIIVKLNSEGVKDGNRTIEASFNGCISHALDWLNQKVADLGEKPVVALINSGVQLWGPNDGSSKVSRKIDRVFGNRPGKIFVAPAGDEGCLQTHAGGPYSSQTSIVNFARSSGQFSELAMWFKGPPLSVDVEFDDDHQKLSARTDAPGEYDGANGTSLSVYGPRQEFYPVTSSSGDRLVYLRLSGHAGAGRIVLRGFAAEVGRFDMYSDSDAPGDQSDPCPDYGAVTSFKDRPASGRLTDYASTKSAIVIGAYVSTSSWVDLQGHAQTKNQEVPGQLWSGSAGGPTRDQRRGVDITAPGEGVFTTYAADSFWVTIKENLIQDGGGHYGRAGATSGAAPIAVGAIALMLEMKPDLTSDQARSLLTETATLDRDTGPMPKNDWGYGKLNVRAAIDRLCALYKPARCSNTP
jgi:Subtilase family